MKTLEVLNKVLAGKSLAADSKRKMNYVLTKFSEYSPEWPDNGIVINEWMNTLTVADISKRTYFAYMQSAGDYIERYYKIDNPAKTAETPRYRKRQRRYFTPDEMMMIAGACKYRYDRELILTLMDSLCRVGGLAGLKGKDVLENHIVVNEKTGQRKYRLDTRICTALRNLAGEPESYVFAKGNGEPENVNNLIKRVRTVIARAGITGSKVSAHTLRHSGATVVAREYRNVLIVQTLLQHDRPDTSMQYIHDIDIEIHKDISPLQLISKQSSKGNGANPYDIKPRQIGMGEGEGEVTDIALSEPEVVEGAKDFYGDMFPEITDDVNVRPLLKTDDLRLLRRIFVDIARRGGDHQDIMRARELMRRVTRKIK